MLGSRFFSDPGRAVQLVRATGVPSGCGLPAVSSLSPVDLCLSAGANHFRAAFRPGIWEEPHQPRLEFDIIDSPGYRLHPPRQTQQSSPVPNHRAIGDAYIVTMDQPPPP